MDVFGKTIYFNDPDGNGAEIYRDRPRGEWPQTQDGGIDMGVGPLDLDALLAEAEQHAQNTPGTHPAREMRPIVPWPLGAVALARALGHHGRNREKEPAMRKFLVVLDNSSECLNAMRFAAMRAQNTGGGVEILAVIPPEEFNHWIGVGEIMREEARERIEAHYEVFAKWMREKHNVDPELVVREGEVVPEILAQVREDPEVGVLVLGAGNDNPIINQLVRAASTLPVPMTIVPGEMSKERLSEIT